MNEMSVPSNNIFKDAAFAAALTTKDNYLRQVQGRAGAANCREDILQLWDDRDELIHGRGEVLNTVTTLYKAIKNSGKYELKH